MKADLMHSYITEGKRKKATVIVHSRIVASGAVSNVAEEKKEKVRTVQGVDCMKTDKRAVRKSR